MSLLQPTEPIEIMKQKAALRALECVRPGMKLGLGAAQPFMTFFCFGACHLARTYRAIVLV